MASSQIQNIKQVIKDKLANLMDLGTIKFYEVDDYKTGIFDRNIPSFPAAILTTPSVNSDYLTNVQNIRQYIFQIVVVMKGEDIEDATEVENLIQEFLNAFDEDPDLGGTADGGVEPSTSSPEAVTSAGGKSFIAFAVTVKAKVVKDIT